MMKRLYSVAQRTGILGIWALICIIGVHAQTINVFNVNTDAYPKITADYIAFDNIGTAITGLTAADFQITETPLNGAPVDLTPTITHDCFTRTTEPEASILLVLDRSQSMRDLVNGKARFKYAQEALTAFVNKIKFNGETRVILTTFAGDFEVSTPWTNDPKVITDTLSKMQPTTVTNYVIPFENEGSTIYDLFAQRPPSIPRYVFFLTDGHPNPTIPNEIKFINENVPKLQQNGIRFFSVTLMEPFTHVTLESFAKATGGKAIVAKESELVDLFNYLALETQIREICQLSWISPYACREDARNRTAVVRLNKFNNPTATISYTTPAKSIGGTKIDFPVLFCGDPAPTKSSQASVTIEATGAPLNVTGFNIVPTGYFKVVDWGRGSGSTFTPFTLNPGQKVIVKVEFTQGTQQIFRQSQLQLLGTPCPPTIDLVGGQGFILLNSPTGGELFSTCDTVVIGWSGVLPTTPVRIEYSDDAGATWKIISNDATGLTYKWVAPGPGTKYRIRVSVAPTPQYQWVEQIGSTGVDSATSVAIAPNDLFVYTTGWFDGPGKFGTTTVNNQVGNIDGYLCVYDANGSLNRFMHLKGNDGTGDERVTGCITDKDGNIYVTGYYTSTSATFDGLPLNLAPGDVRNMFVYKFDKNLNLEWGRTGKGYGGNIANANSTGIGIRYDVNGYPLIAVRGKFARYVMVGYTSGGGRAESSRYTNNTLRDYYATYDASGNATFAEGIPPAAFTMQSMKVNDSKGYSYETGSFTGNKTFSPPATTLTSRGNSDAYLSKHGSTPASSAQSDKDFSVSSPELTFSAGSVTMEPTAQGQTSAKSFPAILCNTGNFVVEIVSATFTGANASDFGLQGNLQKVRIKPGECLSLEFVFTPSGINTRTAVLEVRGTCNTLARLTVEAVGLAPCLWEAQSVVDLGKIALGAAQKIYTIDSVICNKGPLPLSGILSSTGSPDIVITSGGGNFTLAPNACHSIQVTVAPNTAGSQNITLAYNLASECGVPNTSIRIEVVEPKVSITSVDFGRHRVGTVVNDSIFIENQSTQPVTITNFTPSGASNTNLAFQISGLPSSLVLNSGERKTIGVVFTPVSRGPHSTSLSATVAGQSAPLVSTATGIGFLPAINAAGHTFPAVTVGQTATPNGYVRIENTDSDSPLLIGDVQLSGLVPDFTAVNWPIFPVTIPVGGNLQLEVSFTAQAAGTRVDDVVISHDAKTGPDAIPPYATTTVQVIGIGIDQSSLPPVAFGNVLTCTTKSVTVTITNPNPSTPLICNSPVVTGDVVAFTASPSGSFTINPGESQTVTIDFAPPSAGVFSATFTYPNNQSLDLIVNAMGTGITTNAAFTLGPSQPINVGKPFAIPVMVTIGDMQGVRVTGVKITLDYPSEFLSFSSVSATQPGWSFVPSGQAPGTVVLEGVSDVGSTLVNGMIVTATMNPFLTADHSHQITVSATVTPTCVIASGDTHSYPVTQVCYSEGRLITIGRTAFSISTPRPNPAADVAVINYSTGVQCSTLFEVVDYLGNIVRSITTPVLEGGEYALDLDVSTIGSGLYTLRMISGPFVGSQILSVVR
ncbi:MAG: choice-of-anchor D domain-containing protein [Candidatus Kapabacteria bacterium]|nr:choice-of-anchor D domain-containing protein [Candidatus Kapabacteria bacterium]